MGRTVAHLGNLPARMNLFTGMSTNEILSTAFTFLLFGFYVTLIAVALGAFYVTSRPREGRVRTAAMWHFWAVILTMVSIVSTVWAAPAQKSFLDDDTVSRLFPFDAITSFDLAWRFPKVIIGFLVALLAILSILIGIVRGRMQKRAWQEEQLAA